MEKGLTKNDSLALKGVAIAIMLFHHLFGEAHRFEDYSVNFAPFSQDTVVGVSWFFRICVSMFAFITGYGLLKSICNTEINKKNLSKWYCTRLVKTMSGFWIIYLIAFVVTMLLNRLPIETYFDKSRLLGVLYVIIDFLGLANLFGTSTLNSTWWYMSAAVIFILIVPLVYKASQKFGYLPIVFAVIALPRLLRVGYPGGVNAYSFILPVVLGMVFAEYNIFEKITSLLPKKPIASYITSFVVFGVMTVLAYRLYTVYPHNKGWEYNFAVVPVIVICLCRYCIVRLPVAKQVLCFLGKHSMTIFLTHTFIRYVYLQDFVYSFEHFMLIYAVLMALSIALALVIDWFIMLIKYDKLTGKLITAINKQIDKL